MTYPSLNRFDGLLVACFAVLGAAIGWGLVPQAGSVFFYQSFTPEALMWACGRGFRHPLPLPPDMVAFLWQRTLPTFDCSSVAVDLPSGPPGIFFHVQLYLSCAAALLWRLLGPSQIALAPLAALLAAGYASGGFMLGRLFLPRFLAVAAGLVLALSPVAIGQIFSLRDFSKAPFLLWALALLIMATRSAPRRGLISASLAGVVAGIGYGFRGDVAIILPLGIWFLAIAPRGHLRSRAGLVGGFAVSLLLVASPILVFAPSSSSGLLVMQGATEPFRAFLALGHAPYALGQAYSDELTFSGIAAEESERRRDWKAGEGLPVYGISQAVTLSSKNLASWAPHFGADFMTQALKGAGWILGYPALVATARGIPDPGTALRLNVPLTRWQEPAYSWLGQPWMPALGLIGVFALLLRTAARSKREAWAMAGLLLALLTYPVVQFSIRHIFYLEFIWIVGVLSLPCALFEWRRLRAFLPGLSLAVMIGFGLIATVYGGMAWLQQRWLASDFADLLSSPRDPVEVSRTVQKDGVTMLRVSVPPADEPETVDRADSMVMDGATPVPAVTGIEYDVRASGERMLMTVGGRSCPDLPVRIKLAYDKRSDVWQPFDSELTVRAGSAVLFPAFYRASQHFAGVVIPATLAACDIELFRVHDSHRLPMVLTAVLPPDWRSISLRKTLGSFELRPQRYD